MSEPMSDERLAEIEARWSQPPTGLYPDGTEQADIRTALELIAEVKRVHALVTLPDPKGGCTCWLPMEQWDTSYYGIAEPGSQMEYDPACPEHSHHVYDPRKGEWVDTDARVVELEAERVAFSAAVGFGDNVSEPAATLQEMVEPLKDALAAAQDHDDCPVWCDDEGQWERPRSCEPCAGSGYGGPLIQSVDNVQGWSDCEQCGGTGTNHKRYSIGEDFALVEAQERVAELERWDEAADRFGLPRGDVEGFIRHHRGSAAMAMGAWQLSAELCKARAEKAEARVAELEGQVQGARLGADKALSMARLMERDCISRGTRSTSATRRRLATIIAALDGSEPTP